MSSAAHDPDDEIFFMETGGEKLTEHLTSNTLKYLDRLVALAALDEVGSATEAGRLLGRADRWVRDAVKDLAGDLGVDSLVPREPGSKTRASGHIALEAREIGRSIVYLTGRLARLKDSNIRVRYLPQHGFFMAGVEANIGSQVNLHPKTLGEEDRSVKRFREEVLAAVAAGAVDLAIGLPPLPKVAQENNLEVTYLYSSRQEAMVPTDEPLDQITLTELITRDLLLPPQNTRSRDTLNTAIRGDAPHEPMRVRREAFGTKVLIQYGMKGLGTVVVPSDIAHVFKYGNDHGGPPTRAYKWIPVVRTTGACIYQKVFATMRGNRDSRTDAVRDVLAAVQLEVQRLKLETDPNAGKPA